MNDYPNITALADGRVNGRVSEYILLKPEARDLLTELARLTSALEAAERGLEQNEIDFHLFGCSDNQCSYADPPNQVGTNGGCSCHSRSGFREAIRRVRVRNRKCLAEIAEIKGSKG